MQIKQLIGFDSCQSAAILEYARRHGLQKIVIHTQQEFALPKIKEKTPKARAETVTTSLHNHRGISGSISNPM